MEAQDATHNITQSPLTPPTTTPEAILVDEARPAKVEVNVQQQSTGTLQTNELTFNSSLTMVAPGVQPGTSTPEPISTTVVKYEIQTVQTEAGKLLELEKHELLQVEGDAQRLLLKAEEHVTVRTAIKDAATFGEFWLKFLNDWSFTFASGLAYHLLMAIFPIVIATGAILGLIAGGLSAHAQEALVNYMSGIFPAVLGRDVLTPALVLLRKNADTLGLLAIVLALYSGSRLFASMEDCFAIIYHTPTRSFWGQNLMALVILLLFILLIPVMLLASSIGLSGFFGGLLASLILFQIIYMIVPNQKISWRKTWRGTLVAAVALQVYILVFPLYIRHFLGSYTGNIGFAIILLLFFFYFAVILLLGAEVNAFYAEGVRAKPLSLATMVHQATLATDKAELLKLARERAAKRRAVKP